MSQNQQGASSSVFSFYLSDVLSHVFTHLSYSARLCKAQVKTTFLPNYPSPLQSSELLPHQDHDAFSPYVSIGHTIPAFLCIMCLPKESINLRRADTLSLTSLCTLCIDDFNDSLHPCSPGLSKPWKSPDIYLVANS